MVCAAPIHLRRPLLAAPDIARTDNDADLNARLTALFKHGGYLVNKGKVQNPVLPVRGCQRLAG